MSGFDPYSGYNAAGHVPDYYNPYKNYSAAAVSQQQAQHQGQAGMPGKDAPTPGSKHGARQRVRMQHPVTGEVREIDAQLAQRYVAKGGRIV